MSGEREKQRGKLDTETHRHRLCEKAPTPSE